MNVISIGVLIEKLHVNGKHLTREPRMGITNEKLITF